MARETGRRSAAETIPTSNMFSAWNLLVLILAISLLFLWKSWDSLADIWNQRSEYSHGYVIAIISIGLFLKLRPELNTEKTNPQLAGLLLLSAMLFVWLLMRLASIQTVELLMLPIIVWLMCLTALGWPISKKLIFPLFYLYFAIPIWQSGNFILQSLTVKATEGFLAVAGILAYIDGNRVFLTSGTFKIADGCSGINYFIVAVALSVLYGYLYLPNIYRQTALVIIAVILALVMNWLRVFIIIYAGYATDMQHYLVTVDHVTFGWFLFALFLVPLLLIARQLEDNNANISTKKIAMTHEQQGFVIDHKRKTIPALIAIAVLLVSVSLFEVIKAAPSQETCVSIQVSSGNNIWREDNSMKGDWSPVYIGVESEEFKHYRNGEQYVTLYANLYSHQSQGEELIGYENKIEGDNGWVQSDSTINRIALDDDVTLTVREILLEAGSNNRRIIYYWYNIDGLKSIDDLTAKLWHGVFMLVKRPYSGLIAVSSRCEQENCEIARSNLDDWLMNEWKNSELILMHSQPDCE